MYTKSHQCERIMSMNNEAELAEQRGGVVAFRASASAQLGEWLLHSLRR
jgi:hypothetical protein